ncbi:hypothetical protein HMPREF1990_01248, partial [Porphyromonas gingivalis W4087]
MSSIEKIKTKSLAVQTSARLFLCPKFSRQYIIGSSMRGKKSDSESSDSLNNHTPKKFSTTKMS